MVKGIIVKRKRVEEAIRGMMKEIGVEMEIEKVWRRKGRTEKGERWW